MAASARQIAKWCGYIAVAAAPGSLLVLPLWLLRRHLASRAAWRARPPRKSPLDLRSSSKLTREGHHDAKEAKRLDTKVKKARFPTAKDRRPPKPD